MTDNVEDFLTDDQRAAFAEMTVRRPRETPVGHQLEFSIDCPDCGYQIDSFACKIRHIQINSGAAKAAND